MRRFGLLITQYAGTRAQVGTRARGTLGVLGLALGFAGLVAGCGAASSPPGGHGPTQSVTHSASQTPGQTGAGRGYQISNADTCPSTSTDPDIARLRALTGQSALPANFTVVAVVRCYTEQRAVAGDGIWQFALAQRASTNLAEFVRLLHQPNETMSPQANFGCPLSLLMVPAFGLVGSDGKVIQPLLPVDVCGDALPNVLTAFSGLPWKTEAEAKLNQLQTQAEINTGCPSAYKYLPALKVDTSTGSPIPWSRVRQIAAFPINQVCLFRLDGAATAADPVPAGTFVAGALLTTAQGGALQTAISGASTAGSAAPACSVRATRFAMIGSQKQGLNYLVELDGCRRLMFPNSYFATAPAGLYSALAQVGIK